MSASVNNWNPMQEAFENKKFNPDLDHAGNKNSSDATFSLFVGGIPRELSQNGLRNLFAPYGTVVSTKILSPKPESAKTVVGFVAFRSLREAENALKDLNGFKFGQYSLRVNHASQRKKSENNFSDLLHKLEKGPLIDAHLKDLMLKTETAFDQKHTSRSDSSCKTDHTVSSESNQFSSKAMRSPPPPQRLPMSNGGSGSKTQFQQPPKQFNQPKVLSERSNESFKKNYIVSERSSRKYNEISIEKNQNLNERNQLPKDISQNSSDGDLSNAVNSSIRMVDNQSAEKNKPNVSNVSANTKKKKEKSRKPCYICKTPTDKMCASCSVTHYCSQVCQKQDWPQHKRICHQLKEDSLDTDEPLIVIDETLCDNLSHLLKGLGSPKSYSKCPAVVTTKTTISLLPPQFKPNNIIHLVVIDVIPDNGIILSQDADEASLTLLNKTQVALNKHYFAHKQPLLSSPVEGDACACLFSEDRQWYRCVVMKLFPDKTALVLYVDYGNMEKVKLEQLMYLDDSFCQHSAFCVKCKLLGCDGPNGWTEKQTTFFSSMVKQSNAVFKAKIANITNDTVFVKLKFGDVYVNEKMRDLLQSNGADPPKTSINEVPEKIKSISKLSVPSNDDSSSSVQENSTRKSISCKNKDVPLSKSLSYEPLNLAAIPDGKFTVIISYVESPGCFFSQVLNDDLVTLHQTLERLASGSVLKQDAYVPAVGEFCSAVYADDGRWCRGKVLHAINPDLYLVQYIDFGNKAEVTVDKIRPLPGEFRLPIQTFQSSLADCFPLPGQSWRADATDVLKALENDSCVVQVKQKRADIIDLIVYDEESSTINQNLASLGLAVYEDSAAIASSQSEYSSPREEALKRFPISENLLARKPILNEILQISITATEKEGKFYCQLVHEDLLTLSELVDKLTAHCNKNIGEVKENIFQGKVCAAFYTSGATWNRAIVLSSSESETIGKVLVRFVDYGNCEHVSVEQIKSLPAEYKNFPTQAILCSLADVKPMPGPEWSEEVTTELNNSMEIPLYEAMFVACEEDCYQVKFPALVNKLIIKGIGQYAF